MAAPPDVVVSFLLENLKDFVASNAELIGGAQDCANALCDELEVLKGFLKKCTDQNYRDDGFLAGLAKKVRRLVHRAEDAIETYIARVSKQKCSDEVTGAIHSIDHALELRNIGKELDALKEEVHDAYQREIDKGLVVMQRVDKAKANYDESKAKKHPVDDDMVAFKDATEDVIQYLKGGPDDLQTVSIVGMLGLGKTRIAKEVFKHPTVGFQFFVRAFVEVSQEFKRKEVLLKLVHAFGNVSAEDMNRMDEDQLEEAIKIYLEKRSFLIVLDDVWTGEAWDQFKACFPNNQKHSRILITTRNRRVAEHARQGLGFEPYNLRFLNVQESKELLRKRVFGRTDTIKPDLEVHETAILDRCDGLPLAIVVVAGILANHREESYWWEDVARKVETFNLSQHADYAIQLSFNHLPYHLKPCFVYLGVFPEDFEIPTKILFQLWVSEGFVPPGDANETSEDKAESYLEQLVERSLVVVEKRRLNGRIKTIRIEDSLREFCKVQAAEEELFREIRCYEQARNMYPDEDIRRLCVNSNVLEYITSKNKPSGKFVRSFLSFTKEDYILPLEYISEIPKAFQLLRVLDIRSIRFTEIPTELFYWFLLKYIALCSDQKTIPEEMSNLRYLQTFIFKTMQRRIEIKADIWKMKQLSHLETNASTSLQKSKEALSINANLQTLSAISPESCTPEVFKRAQQLKKLGVCGELAPLMDTLFNALSELGCLENLKLLNASTTVFLKSLPDHTSFPRKLTRLTLQNTMLSWEWMSILAKLNKLEVLKLKENAFRGGHWDTENTGAFVALKVLHIGKTDLITWKATKGYFPQLTQLYLRHCPRLGNIPSDIVNISTLKLIDIYCCKPKVANSFRKLLNAKHQVQAQENNGKNTQLKLFVYPPEQ